MATIKETLVKALENVHDASLQFASERTEIWFSVNMMAYDTEKQEPEHGASAIQFNFPIHALMVPSEIKIKGRVLCDPEHYKYFRRKHGRALHCSLSICLHDTLGAWTLPVGSQVKLGKYDDGIAIIPSFFAEEPDYSIELIRSKQGDLEEMILNYSSKSHPMATKEVLGRSALAARNDLSIYFKAIPSN